MKETKTPSTQPYKGTRDFYPEEFAKRQYLFDVWTKVCQRYGYEQYDTPILEPLELYASKTSEEIVGKESFVFTDRGGREVMLRPEMTPSLARIIAGKRQELGYPLRLFVIPGCYRYERPQKGRWREFWQLNADIFGSADPNSDAEIIMLADSILKELGAKPEMYDIQISDRRFLDWLLQEKLNLSSENALQAIRLIDKKSKISKEYFNSGLQELGVNQDGLILANQILEVGELGELPEEAKAQDWYEYLEAAFEVLDSAGVKFNFNPQIARGFDYYTGFVFEVFDTDPTNNRAMFGGGRYDGLVAKFGVDPVPVVGFGMGDAVQWEMLDANNLWPALPPATEAMLIPLNLSSVSKANKFAAELRKQGQNIAIDFDVQRKLEKRIKAAQKLQIPKIGIIGDNENSFKDIKFKELNNGYR